MCGDARSRRQSNAACAHWQVMTLGLALLLRQCVDVPQGAETVARLPGIMTFLHRVYNTGKLGAEHATVSTKKLLF